MRLAATARLAAALGLVLAAGGCATFGTFQTARTLGKGRSRVAVEASAWGAVSPAATRLAPDVAVAARWGLTDRFDLGGRIGGHGLELDAKLQLTPPKRPGLVVSLAPAVGGGTLAVRTAVATTAYVQVPVLLGLRLGSRVRLVLGPKLELWYVRAGDSSTSTGIVAARFFGVGTSVGVSVRLTRGLRVLPELTVIYPVAAWGVTSTTAATHTGLLVGTAKGVAAQVGVAVLFGD